MQQTISHTVEAELPIDVRIHPTHFTTADIMALDAPSSPLSSVPSSPLSSLGRTPTPPRDYPSPPLSTLSGTTSPMPKLRFSQDGPPPAKKRKLSAPKPRTTERLDLTSFGDNSTKEQIDHQVNQLKRLVHALRGKRKIVVVAGAGISVSAGIPDFRSSQGLFTTLKSQHKLKSSGKELFDASVYKDDVSTSSFHSMVRTLAQQTKNAQPTDFHHMLASLAADGRLLRLYTQNVDGIDTALLPLQTNVPLNAKGPWPKSVQLHGGLDKMVCSKCGALSDFEGSLFDGPEAPSCPACIDFDTARTCAGMRSHGIGCLRPRMVLYNEFNPDSDAIGNVSHADLKSRPDAVIVVGTSLKVPGIRRLVRELCAVTRGRKDGFTAWINLDEPAAEFKDCWDLVVRSESDTVAHHVNLRRWDDTTDKTSVVQEDEWSGMIARKSLPCVEVPTTPSKQLKLSWPMGLGIKKAFEVVITSPSIPTPAPTPPPVVALGKDMQHAIKIRKPLPSTAKTQSTASAHKIGKSAGTARGRGSKKQRDEAIRATNQTIRNFSKVSKAVFPAADKNETSNVVSQATTKVLKEAQV